MPELGRLDVGQEVRFSDDWLARLPEAERRRYQGRVGHVCGYRLGAQSPIVLFPRAGRLKEVKLFEVNPRQLDLLPRT